MRLIYQLLIYQIAALIYHANVLTPFRCFRIIMMFVCLNFAIYLNIYKAMFVDEADENITYAPEIISVDCCSYFY